MFGVGPLELGVILLVGVILLGPDKMPGYARDAARLLKKFRTMADEATKDIREEMGPEYKDLDPRQLHPRALIQKHIIEPAWADDDGNLPLGSTPPDITRGRSGGQASQASSVGTSPAPVRQTPAVPAQPSGGGTPWDADAT